MDNKSMRVFLKTLTGKTLTIDFEEKDTIAIIKQKIFHKEGVPPNTCWIQFAGKRVGRYDGETDNVELLYDYGIRNESTAHLILKLKGGNDMFQFNFNSLEDKITLQFSKEGPKYLQVSEGLNLLAECKNENCEAYEKYVYVQLGFGKFNIGKEICTAKCPVCLKFTKDAVNIGYYKTHISVEGMKNDPSERVSWNETVTKNELTTFKHEDSQIRKWKFLEITTQKL